MIQSSHIKPIKLYLPSTGNIKMAIQHSPYHTQLLQQGYKPLEPSTLDKIEHVIDQLCNLPTKSTSSFSSQS